MPIYQTDVASPGYSQNGGLAITGQQPRITGDFSNATIANRVIVQTNTANSATRFSLAPNGTATQSAFDFYNSSDVNNASLGVFTCLSSEVRFNSSFTGTGSYLPMTFYTGGAERMRIDTSGNVSTTGANASFGFKLDLGTGLIKSNNATVLTSAGGYTMTGGGAITAFNLGNTLGATITPSPFNGNYQYVTNNGNPTAFNAPTTDCAIDILISNTTGASAFTFTGYTVVSTNYGDPLTTSTTAKFILSIRRINSISTYVIKQIAT